MEQRKNNIFMPLLLNALKAKKNWFFLSTVIIFITTFLIPYILGMKMTGLNFFISFGVFETFALVFVNCLVDSSFFHNDSKLAYYKSKPLSFREQVAINIIINMVFAGFLLVLIALSVILQGLDHEIFEAFKVFIPWLLTGIFLAALSSILAGNTLVAGAMTLFNFALPGIVYLIIRFMFSILENIVDGFSANVLMEYFVDKFYKLEYIYFAEYSGKSVDCVYFLMLGIILTVTTLLIFKLLKRRKNENTGNFIAFDGYKYFVSVLASIIVPAFFSLTGYTRSIFNEIIVSLLIAALTYYLIIAVIEKSFRISRLSVKVFALSMTVFIAATGGTVAFANQYKDVVPDAEDVKFAYVGSDTWFLRSMEQYTEDKGNLDHDDIIKLRDNYGITLFSDKENIQAIIDLHKEMLANQDYIYDDYWMNSLSVIYFMNDGSLIMRDYKIDRDNGTSGNERKNELASRLLNSQEFKETKYYYLYDEEYYTNMYHNIGVSIGNDITGKNVIFDITLDEIRPYLLKDINEQFKESDEAFIALSSYNFSYPVKRFDDPGYYLEIVIRDKEKSTEERIETLYFNEGYENLKEYLEPRLQ